VRNPGYLRTLDAAVSQTTCGRWLLETQATP